MRRSDLRTGPRTVAVAALGMAVFNYPMLALMNQDDFVLGIPLLWFSLFTSWLALIGLLALVLRQG